VGLGICEKFTLRIVETTGFLSNKQYSAISSLFSSRFYGTELLSYIDGEILAIDCYGNYLKRRGK